MARRTGARLGAALSVLALVGAGLTACNSTSKTSTTINGGMLKIGTSYPIDSLNPFVSQADYAYVVYQYVYPQLTQYNAKVEIAPDFAKSWSVSPDGKTWTFKTVPNATWSDGQPLTAADAAWTINMVVKYQAGPTASAAGVVAHIVNAVATDANTLEVHYAQPVDNVLSQMQQLPILPRQVWGALATGDGSKLKTFQNNAPLVSGGPFILQQYAKNQSAIFARNPHWWGPKPHIDGFGFEFFSNDDAMVTALKTGQIDMTGEYTPPTAVAALQRAGFVVTTQPSVSMKTFIINTNPKKTAHRELLDPKVRQAMEYAIDRSQIIDVAWLGHAQSGSTIIAPADGGWHNTDIQALPFDLAKANQILDSLGYTKGSNGIRIANGHPMAYDVVFPTDENGAGDRTFQIIQNDFNQIGIQITQRTMDSSAATAAVSNPNNLYQTYDLAMWDWVPPVDPDFMLSVMTCAAWGNNSDSGYCNHAYDAMYAKQSTLTDPAARKRLVDAMQTTVYNDRPYIILNYPDVIEAHSKAWTGFVMSPVMGSVTSLSTDTLLSVHKVG